MPASAGGPDVAAAFAELAGTLASDSDVARYLTDVCRQCVRLVGVDSAAMFYTAGAGGNLSDVVASDDRGQALASAAVSAADCPWREAARSGQLFTIADLPVHGQRWPWFTDMAMQAGFLTATLVPLGPQAGRAGAIALLGRTEPDVAGIQLALCLADAEAAGLALNAELQRQQTAISQLQSALTSRIVIEQAKGILAERWQVTPDQAFDALRRQARAHQQVLADLARAVISGTADISRPNQP